ncbi:MAG: histidine triad nucleotide-binding protein [Chloroflexota bacterium]|nr:histidine triad nucleotide-binding protein [Chloroflexota bacterium]
MSESCVFCKVATGEIESKKVYQDELVTAFRDLNPQAPTHVLIVPNEHIESIAHVGDHHPSLVLRMMVVANRIAQSEGRTGGYRLVTNVGADAGQSVLHLHWHLIGGRKMAWPPG